MSENVQITTVHPWLLMGICMSRDCGDYGSLSLNTASGGTNVRENKKVNEKNDDGWNDHHHDPRVNSHPVGRSTDLEIVFDTDSSRLTFLCAGAAGFVR